MSLHKKLMQICNDRDLSSYLEMLHDDFTVVFHKSGNSFSKEEWSSMVAGMFDNEKFVFESSRCVYENSEIMVDHSFMSYPDGTREAVMLVAKLKDGKILHMETGATSLDQRGYTIFRLRQQACECPPDIVDAIRGWKTSGVGHGYGNGYPLDVLNRWMNKIS